MSDLAIVIMTKRPEPGRVKTRIARAALVDDAGAAELARAMLACTLARTAAYAEDFVLAVAPDPRDGDDRRLVPPGLARRPRLIGQGAGDLGRRLDRVWRAVGLDRPVAFFGIDSPDVPRSSLASIGPALERADVALGPTSDGGYWTLAARRHRPALLRGIDWGGGSVYDQTCRRAAEAGLTLASLPPWHDVDRPEDVLALRGRLVADGAPGAAPDDPDLARLAARLDTLLAGGTGTRKCQGP